MTLCGKLYRGGEHGPCVKPANHGAAHVEEGGLFAWWGEDEEIVMSGYKIEGPPFPNCATREEYERGKAKGWREGIEAAAQCADNFAAMVGGGPGDPNGKARHALVIVAGLIRKLQPAPGEAKEPT